MFIKCLLCCLVERESWSKQHVWQAREHRGYINIKGMYVLEAFWKLGFCFFEWFRVVFCLKLELCCNKWLDWFVWSFGTGYRFLIKTRVTFTSCSTTFCLRELSTLVSLYFKAPVRVFDPYETHLCLMMIKMNELSSVHSIQASYKWAHVEGVHHKE